MKEFQVSTTIDAAPERVWEVLMDTAAYSEWDPCTIRIEGRAALGEKIKAYSTLSPDRAFPVTVTEFVPNQKMTWADGMPLGLFKGVRTFTLSAQGEGTTEFTLHEAFTGPMMVLIGRTIPDMTEAFESFASGLKRRAEEGGAGESGASEESGGGGR